MSIRGILFGVLAISCAFGASYSYGNTVCEDLASYSCSPGHVDDGTGSYLSDREFEKKMQGILEKFTESATKDIGAYVRGNNAHFNRLAINGLGLNLSPLCTNPRSETCLNVLTESLVNLARKRSLRNFIPQVSQNRNVNLEALDSVMNNHRFKKVLDKLDQQVYDTLSETDEAKKIQTKVLPKVRELILQRLRTLPIDESKRQLMIDKVKDIGFAGTDCSGQDHNGRHKHMRRGAGEPNRIDGLLTTNAFYDGGSNSIMFCSGFILRNTSEFHYAGIIAHELAHSIDPCLISTGGKGMAIMEYKPVDKQEELDSQYPIQNVVSCLRRSDSVFAQTFIPPDQNLCNEPTNDDKGPPGPHPPGVSDECDGGGETPHVRGRRAGPEGVPEPGTEGKDGQTKNVNAERTPDFCSGDQSGEAFSDWLAAEVLPDYIKEMHPNLTKQQRINGYSNVFRSICDSTPVDGPPAGEHPGTRNRINGILLTQPQIREQMGCSGSHPNKVYCDANNPPPSVNDQTTIDGTHNMRIKNPGFRGREQ